MHNINNTNIDVLKAIIEITHFLSSLFCIDINVFCIPFAYNESETLVHMQVHYHIMIHACLSSISY